MLKGVGIELKLNDDIKHNKHPYITFLEDYLSDRCVEFMVFEGTDTMVIVDCDSDILKNAVIMPTTQGYSVLVTCKKIDDTDKFLQEVAEALEDIMPPDVCYDVVGVI
tara:strand:+ start:1559 stop:1882 length:324 start_codon:yes stop_codon:yes gene_type:complete